MEYQECTLEFEAFAIQLGVLKIFCEICKEEDDQKEKKFHRSKFSEACLGIIQQSLLTLGTDMDISSMNGNMATFIELCGKCDGKKGLVAEELARRHKTQGQHEESINKNKSTKVIRIKGVNAPE